MCLTSGTQQNDEIKDEVNVQPHAMKGTSCIILCVFNWYYVIFIAHWQVLCKVYKCRARGRGAYKLHIA